MNGKRSSSDGEEKNSLPHNEWEKLKSDRMKEGYREGISAGEEASLQQGFNQGYVTGFQIVEEVARLRGTVTAISELLHQRKLKEEQEEEEEEVDTAMSSTDIGCRSSLNEVAKELLTIETELTEEAASNDRSEEAKLRTADNRRTRDIEARLVVIKSNCAKILEKYDTTMTKLFQ